METDPFLNLLKIFLQTRATGTLARFEIDIVERSRVLPVRLGKVGYVKFSSDREPDPCLRSVCSNLKVFFGP